MSNWERPKGDPYWQSMGTRSISQDICASRTRDGMGEKNKGLRQRVQRVGSDLNRLEIGWKMSCPTSEVKCALKLHR